MQNAPSRMFSNRLTVIFLSIAMFIQGCLFFVIADSDSFQSVSADDLRLIPENRSSMNAIRDGRLIVQVNIVALNRTLYASLLVLFILTCMSLVNLSLRG